MERGHPFDHIQTDKISSLQSTLSTFWYPVESNLRPWNGISPDKSACVYRLTNAGITGNTKAMLNKERRDVARDELIPSVSLSSRSQKTQLCLERERSTNYNSLENRILGASSNNLLARCVPNHWQKLNPSGRKRTAGSLLLGD
jgi:hypothetical protein